MNTQVLHNLATTYTNTLCSQNLQPAAAPKESNHLDEFWILIRAIFIDRWSSHSAVRLLLSSNTPTVSEKRDKFCNHSFILHFYLSQMCGCRILLSVLYLKRKTNKMVDITYRYHTQEMYVSQQVSSTCKPTGQCVGGIPPATGHF